MLRVVVGMRIIDTMPLARVLHMAPESLHIRQLQDVRLMGFLTQPAQHWTATPSFLPSLDGNPTGPNQQVSSLPNQVPNRS
jgi:hypothetical protein